MLFYLTSIFFIDILIPITINYKIKIIYCEIFIKLTNIYLIILMNTAHDILQIDIGDHYRFIFDKLQIKKINLIMIIYNHL